jgi:hypothetical protein
MLLGGLSCPMMKQSQKAMEDAKNLEEGKTVT